MHRFIRPAKADDGPALFAIRRAAILAAAAPEIAAAWAGAHAPNWIDEILLQRRVWLFESPDGIVGWCSASGNAIDALYTSPAHFTRGVGSSLLAFVEAELEREGFSEVVLNASINAEAFYRSRGYVETGLRHPLESKHRGALPMRKALCNYSE